jgi:hypothetical protein
VRSFERLTTIYIASIESRVIETSETLDSMAAHCGLVDVGVSALLKNDMAAVDGKNFGSGEGRC